MNGKMQDNAEKIAGLERRLTDLAQSKSRYEVINRLLTSLSSIAGLDDMLRHIPNILMQTIGADNIAIIFHLDDSWQYRDIYGTSRPYLGFEDPDVDMVLASGKPVRINRGGIEISSPAGTASIPAETWIFPLLSHGRKIGAVCMEGMQLIDEGIFAELLPFFVYAGLMLDNEISNYSRLAEAHRRLQDSELLYRTLFDQSPDGIMLVNVPDLKPVQFNEVAHAILGYSRDEFANLTVEEIHTSTTPQEIAEFVEILQRDGFTSFEALHRTKTGEHLAMFISLKLLEIGGQPIILAVHRDMTEKKQAEEEHLRLELQILHTQKLESLGVLAGGIAHDFNNILTSIIGNAELALRRINKESPAVENLGRITQAATRAADLAKQMLAYSGKGKFVVENIDLNILLEEMLYMLEVSISKKAVLRLNPCETLPSVEADATQLRQIIMNLVINASEAIGNRSGIIAITTGVMNCNRNYLKDVWLDENLSDGLYVYLEIADTGCGMDRTTLSKLFDPFFTTKFTGRGLGMSAVLGIVRGHKGAIKVYSEPGKGTSFKILLPASAKPTDIINTDSPKNDWQGSGRVLLVDDEETIRGIGAEMLQELGFSTLTAEDGKEALEVFKANPDIALVILDLTMPHMDGEQCFRELKQLKPDIKVIMSSGYNEQEVTQKFSGKGLAGFVQKPYTLSILTEAIRLIL